MGKAGEGGFGELQRGEFIIVPAAQIDRLALAPRFRHAEHVGEEGKARLDPGREHLDMAEMGEIPWCFRGS